MQPKSEYRERIQHAFHLIEKAFSNIDPDIAECELSMGALTLTFADQSRCILSAQPSVSQLWLAIASLGSAYHFNYQNDRWVDDKGRGIELFDFLEKFLKESIGLEVKF